MAGHLVSATVSGFHIGEDTDVETAHFWSQGLLVNDVRSWQLIIKHYLTHRFHVQTLIVSSPMSRFHTVLKPALLLSKGPLVNGVRRW